MVTERPVSVCVFCGSSPTVDPVFTTLGREVGARIAARGARVVYGGASIGVMGAVADGALTSGGTVLGVIPARLDEREVAHRGVTDLRVVDSMHTRKALMAEESDAFVALPGGYGTLDELFEITTWRQLGLHAKPIALLDAHDYYAPLFAWIDGAVHARFVAPEVARAIERLDDPGALTRWMQRVLPVAQ